MRPRRLLKKPHRLRCAQSPSLQLAYRVWLIAHVSYGQTICHRRSAICEARARLASELFEQPAEKVLNSLAREVLQMSQTDWAKIYAKMDKRIVVKYEQLPK